MDTKINSPFHAQKSQTSVKVTGPSHINDRETFIHCSQQIVIHPFTEVFNFFFFEPSIGGDFAYVYGSRDALVSV